MLKQTILAVISTFAASAILAQAYKWTDEDGVVHYSDRPTQGAEEIQLPAEVDRPAPAPQRITRKAGGTAADEAVERLAFQYESLSIDSPVAEETLWNIAGVLNVTLTAKPALQPGHRLRVYFDGTPRMVASPSFQIDEVYRGMHNIQAEIIDRSDNLMIRSTPNRFYVQQTNIIVRPN